MNKPELYQAFNNTEHNISIVTLKEYTDKIKWNITGDTAIDLGCGEGGISVLLKNYAPCSFKNFVACDISEEMIKYAEKRYADENISFRVLDMEGEVPVDMKEAFNHVFSFYALHWAKDQEKMFQNIYDLMSNEADCFMIFMGTGALHSVYAAIAQNPKWKSWLKNVDRFISPYHGLKEPNKRVEDLMERCGFKNIDVKCKKITNVYKSVQDMREFVQCIEPFNMPSDVMDNFIEDYVTVGQEIGVIRIENNDYNEKTFVTNDILLIAYANKCCK